MYRNTDYNCPVRALASERFHTARAEREAFIAKCDMVDRKAELRRRLRPVARVLVSRLPVPVVA